MKAMEVSVSVFLSILIFGNEISATVPRDDFEYIYQAGPRINASKGEVWPLPQHVEYQQKQYFAFFPIFFQFKNVGYSCDILSDALLRYERIIRQHSRLIKTTYYTERSCLDDPADSSFLGSLDSLEVFLEGACNDLEYPSVDMKEEYELIVTDDIQRLSSKSIWGILRGLETMSQLIYLTDDFACHQVDAQIIRDFPKFSHRGLLLDTSRHYISKENILKVIDAMSYNKLNVFHWHLVDDQSFPYESTTFPELSQKGAYHPLIMTYDQAFVKNLIEYARKRGIRVIPEFDTPGHTLTWGLAHPEILTTCFNVPHRRHGPLDPTKNATYSLVFKLFEEIKQVFPDAYLHLGGDEVESACWDSNPDIRAFMEANRLNDSRALQNYYMKKLIKHVESLDRRYIVWEEAFIHGHEMPTDTVVNFWVTNTSIVTVKDAIHKGHPVILSTNWYLDILKTGGNWLDFYMYDLKYLILSEEERQSIIGMEVCMWTEVVDDTNMESRIWPRASAAAERFWQGFVELGTSRDSFETSSNQSGTSTFDISDDIIKLIYPVASRLEEQTCRMNRRNIKAQPPNGPGVCF